VFNQLNLHFAAVLTCNVAKNSYNSPASRVNLINENSQSNVEDGMVTIRLQRGGAKKRPFYQIVVADSRFS